MKDNTRIMLLCMIILLVLPYVFAVPPFQPTQPSTGYTLKIPLDTVLKAGDAKEFEVHVFNISDGVPIVSGVSCYMHLYNTTGNHIYEGFDNTVSHNFDYSFELSGGNFTPFTKTAVFQCNSSTLGGFFEEELFVTNSGEQLTTSDSLLLGIVIVTILVFSIFFFGISIKTENISARVLFISLGVIFLVLNLGLTIILIQDYFFINSNTFNVMSNLFFMITVLSISAMALACVFVLIYVIMSYKKKRGLVDD